VEIAGAIVGDDLTERPLNRGEDEFPPPPFTEGGLNMKRFVMLVLLTVTACLFLSGPAVAQDKQPDATSNCRRARLPLVSAGAGAKVS